jgi:hypothetical protein
MTNASAKVIPMNVQYFEIKDYHILAAALASPAVGEVVI